MKFGNVVKNTEIPGKVIETYLKNENNYTKTINQTGHFCHWLTVANLEGEKYSAKISCHSQNRRTCYMDDNNNASCDCWEEEKRDISVQRKVIRKFFNLQNEEIEVWETSKHIIPSPKIKTPDSEVVESSVSIDDETFAPGWITRVLRLDVKIV